MAGDADMANIDDGASTSSDDSDFAGVEVSEADMNLIIELEARLEALPSDYDAHVQFIDVLRRCGMRERLREVRRAMQARFPLSEGLWLDWVGDELDAVASEEDVPKIEALLETAHGDYLSVALWIQHLELVSTLDPEVGAGTPEGLAKVRGLYERALAAGGLHVTDGPRLWDWAVAFEQGQAALADAPAEQRADAEARVRELFRRRLAAPLVGAPEALAAYEAWEEERKGAPGDDNAAADGAPAVSRQVKRGVTLARRAFELREPFEEAVGAAAAADPPNPSALLSAYLAYIKVEESGDDPARVRVLYERAVAAFPITHFLWLRYGRAMEVAGLAAEAEGVYRRAVRNCPWVGELWARLLRAQERRGGGATAAAATAAAAAAAGLQGPEDVIEVALAHADTLRRQGPAALEPLREIFGAAVATVAAAHPGYFDPQLRIPAYWADCEVSLGGGGEEAVEAGRQVWEGCLSSSGSAGASGAARHASFWLGYVDFERRHATDGMGAPRARALFKRCCARPMEGGGEAQLCRAWLRLEREHGTAEEHLQACLKVEPVIAKAVAAAEAAAAAAGEAPAKAAPPQPAPRAAKKQHRPQAQQQGLSKEELRAMRQQKDPNFGKRRRREDGEDEGAAPGGAAAAGEAPALPAAKKPKQDDAAGDERPAERPRDSGAVPAAPGGGGGGGGPDGGDRFAARRPLTAFVKHLPEDATEESLRQLFAPCGAVRLVKLGLDQETGRHRGFAYVEFGAPEAVEEACKLNGTALGDKTLFVAAANPPGGGGGSGRSGVRGRGRADRGRGDRGRGRGGGGRGGDGVRARGGPRGHVDLGRGVGPSGGGGGGGGSEAARPKPGLGFVPRTAAIQKAKGGDGGGGAPKSNDDFRKMLLEKK